ncbi:dihydroflavonol-4-reductase [Neptunitalea chrysea]|uniref:Dihydroflavonol-4-reductase n=1 Tax=Neptunitalea chrysea TaxID=1647581 RepID=A0A9W6B4W9_9FLAO|nr:aldehyde reductase [Neptunitalea chrysea]GLB52615.1 dihydroflavonol-4-reductase [Neptunitalea chrysea]
MKSKVLLTGVTGFLGSHTAIQLLNKGYIVIGTLRNQSRSEEIKSIIKAHTTNWELLTIVEADLLDVAIWDELTKGVDYVLHIASPFPRKLPKNEIDLVKPARQGTLNVLKAASNNGVKKVVMTSSVASIIYGKTKAELGVEMDENDWTDVGNRKDTTPYFRSKTIAERAAWDFMNTLGTKMELTTILPGAILGPVLEKDFGTSANIVIKLLNGSSPALAKIGFEIVDVRSVANLHILAMESSVSSGKRYVASAGYSMFKEIGAILQKQFPKRTIPKRELPNWVVRLFSNIDTTLKPILVDLGVTRKLNNTKAIKELGWEPISVDEAVISCAKSIFEKGIIKS